MPTCATLQYHAYPLCILPYVQNKDTLCLLLLVISFFPWWAASNLTLAETRGLAYPDTW